MVNYKLVITEYPRVEVEKWYAIAVGEIGIPPSDFYTMTLNDLELAYKGYKQRLEDQTNLLLIALVRSRSDNKYELIHIGEDLGYVVGSLNEREQVFQKLNLCEV